MIGGTDQVHSNHSFERFLINLEHSHIFLFPA